MRLRVHGGNDMVIVILLAAKYRQYHTLWQYATGCFYGLRPLICLLLSHEQGHGCFRGGLLQSVLWRCGIGENLSAVKCQCRFSDRAGGCLLVPPVKEFLDICESSPKVVDDKSVEVFVIEVVVHRAPLGSVPQSKVKPCKCQNWF